jgi:5-methyltetrahydropteroyltriglutamate--homocysteine methyltransferase
MAARPPFHADHVGSLLRPAALQAARGRYRRGEIDARALRAAQDEAIRAAVARQEAIGLHAITDGEFRRDWWHVDFLAGFEGVESTTEGQTAGFVAVDEQPPILKVTGTVRRTHPIVVDDFRALAGMTTRTAKQTIPAPAMLHHRGGRQAVSPTAYPDLDALWADVADAYAAEIADLVRAGCRYLQIDDTSHAMLCDPKFRAAVRGRGDDPEALVSVYAAAINRALAQRPPELAVTMHTCRGNFKSAWLAAGGYEPVAATIFGAIAVDGFFLEFDDARAGDFEPLRHVPHDKVVVVTTKTPALESKDDLRRRIDAAARYVPLERLRLSPQCGFASTHHGNRLDEADQWRKLERIVEVAHDVWGTAA